MQQTGGLYAIHIHSGQSLRAEQAPFHVGTGHVLETQQVRFLVVAIRDDHIRNRFGIRIAFSFHFGDFPFSVYPVVPW